MIKSKTNSNIITEYLIAEKIVLSEKCENDELLMTERPRQSVLSIETPFMVIEEGGFVILDFGKEIQGGIILSTLNVEKDTKLRVVFGESVSESMSEIGVNNATNDHSVRDTVLDISSWQTFSFGNTGFRFVKLESVSNNIKIAGVQALFKHRELEYKGSFECDDELLNRIWKVGAYTVELNMQEYIWDGIKRDRLVWIGDMHPEVSTILSVFGDNEIIRKSLDLIKENTSPNRFMNGIPSYNLWWILIQRDLYVYTGNIDYLNSQKEYFMAMIKNFLSQINADGTHSIEKMFCEWSSANTETEMAAFQAMLVLGMRAAGELCDVYDEYELGVKCQNAAENAAKHIYPYEKNKQVTAMTLIAGMGDEEALCNLLRKGGAKGLSAFWGYYVLIALAKSGKTNVALDIVRNYWGGMLKMGATTFWEDFDIDWMEGATQIDKIVKAGEKDIHADFGRFCYKGLRHSLCHGWSSGPTAFLTGFVAGIQPVEPGYKKVKIQPRLGGLNWVKCTCPTPYGDIRVECTPDETKIDTPREIEIIK